jgi:DNA ligase-1
MALLSDLTALRARVAASPGRLEKRRLVADYLRGLSPDDLRHAVTYLSGRAFPASDARVLNVRGLPVPGPSPSPGPLPAGERVPLTVADVAQAFGAVAEAAGPGARKLRDARLSELVARASAEERDLLQRVIYGEMRMGLSEGLVLEAIAEAAGVAPAGVRRAALVTGDLTAVAALALGQGAEALAAAAPRVFVPLLPMLAEIADDVEEALAAHGGMSAIEYKYDGARIQLHGDGDRVAIWSRRMSDVTRSLPDIVTIAPLPSRARRGGGGRGAAAHAPSLRLPDGRRPLAAGRALREAVGGANARDRRPLARRARHDHDRRGG